MWNKGLINYNYQEGYANQYQQTTADVYKLRFGSLDNMEVI